MNKTRQFFFHSAALAFAASLPPSYGARVWPLHTWGPRDCFTWPFGWRVDWIES
jgi:hypothetical protein